MAKKAKKAKSAKKARSAKKSTNRTTTKKTKKTAKRKYSESAGQEVEREMHRTKKGTARSGPDGKGGKVKSKKQAVAIGLPKARKKGKKVPKKKG
ncbi:DUF6496 domain-containing protein [Tardiphaga sp.]|jgi:hypothetical protein|uniref:DUF6496 domain-containing protein n=1 Tax=Tardiphaga sp. TaxID=1926292 RepID=UPI0037DA5A5E